MKSKSEIVCRTIFDYFVQHQFVSCRPSFLGKLELDGYCKKHELAFEYNGIQHYQYHPYFHKRRTDFERQCERDYQKQILCKRYGIHLMIVPYSYTWRNVYPMSTYIYSILLEAETIRNDTYMVYRCPNAFL